VLKAQSTAFPVVSIIVSATAAQIPIVSDIKVLPGCNNAAVQPAAAIVRAVFHALIFLLN